MIIYNVTTQLEPSIVTQWLAWMKTVHAPKMLATGCFTSYTICELLNLDAVQSPTYTCQYKAASISNYNNYMQQYNYIMVQETIATWGELALSFCTVMQVVN